MKKNRKKKKNSSARILAGLLVLACLAGGGYFYYTKYMKNDVKPSQNNDSEEVEEVKPVKKVQIIDLDDNTRPYGVMINNVSAVWKYQSGLNDAYIVYELLVEGGITREFALFKKFDVEKIQSIRSSRHYFLDYALENDAVYVHWGWSPQAQSDISTLKINNINGLTYENVYFFRDKNVKAAYEHKGYITGENVKKAIEKLKYRSTTESKPLLTYDVDPVDLASKEGAISADYVGIKFSASHTTKFYYDEEKKVYLKSQNNTEMYDFTSKERMTAKNIIIYNISYPNISGDNKGRVNASNIGSGTGYYISEGFAVPITWKKDSRSAKTVYKYSDGTDLIVNDGNTYIEIQPSNQKVVITGKETSEEKTE